MGPTGPSAPLGAYFFLAFFLVAFFFLVSPPSRPRASRGSWLFFWTLGEGQKAVKGKIPSGGGKQYRNPICWGAGRERSGLLLSQRRLPVLPALHELLIERHALLAERTALGRIRRKISTHQTEDLLPADLRLLRAPPQRSDPDDLASEVFDELREETDGRAGADEIL